MKKADAVRAILADRYHQPPQNKVGKAFAPTNIALCKYWGKRDQELNLPVTSSLSISLGDKGATAEIAVHDLGQDKIILNGQVIDLGSQFSKRLIDYLHLFRDSSGHSRAPHGNPRVPHDHSHCHSREGGNPFFRITIESNIPVAAGLASSACGFASIIKALNTLYGWNLTPQELSILARLGSGSASRSIQPGFVEWHVGTKQDGSDSYAELISKDWPELHVGLLIVSQSEKSISSREAMQRTVATSALYSAWPEKVSQDLALIKQAISTHDFELLGKTAESNALNMHATMLSAWPPVSYAIPETLLAMQKVWKLRQEGLPLYFTQDAGPNIKLLFLQKDAEQIKTHFPQAEIISPSS